MKNRMSNIIKGVAALLVVVVIVIAAKFIGGGNKGSVDDTAGSGSGTSIDSTTADGTAGGTTDTAEDGTVTLADTSSLAVNYFHTHSHKKCAYPKSLQRLKMPDFRYNNIYSKSGEVVKADWTVRLHDKCDCDALQLLTKKKISNMNLSSESVTLLSLWAQCYTKAPTHEGIQGNLDILKALYEESMNKANGNGGYDNVKYVVIDMYHSHDTDKKEKTSAQVVDGDTLKLTYYINCSGEDEKKVSVTGTVAKVPTQKPTTTTSNNSGSSNNSNPTTTPVTNGGSGNNGGGNNGGGNSSTNTSSAKVARISATYNGGKVKVGNKVAKNNVTVVATYSNGRSKIVTGFKLTNAKVSKVGKNSVKVTYKGKTDTITVTGYKTSKKLSKITASYTGGKVLINQKVTKSNIKVTAVYKDNSKKTVTAFKISYGKKIKRVGNNTVTVKYKGKTASVYVKGYRLSDPVHNDHNLVTDNSNPSDWDPIEEDTSSNKKNPSDWDPVEEDTSNKKNPSDWDPVEEDTSSNKKNPSDWDPVEDTSKKNPSDWDPVNENSGTGSTTNPNNTTGTGWDPVDNNSGSNSGNTTGSGWDPVDDSSKTGSGWDPVDTNSGSNSGSITGSGWDPVEDSSPSYDPSDWDPVE